ncbi:hypothetical protein COB11_06450 [Candidatus Aerophobetes bacterium]|uniref:Uncharacterized protein n=1 Tax=Aerophobetes bacterium TaxID=2030807 RepID=A0A2A4YED9_UNCAE|nr:MAG: hypothetical protein COB11_06450 [Candidatus Aerophobetes bacterium]
MLKLFKCLLLQFMKNPSGKELEAFIQGNKATFFFAVLNLKVKFQIIWFFAKLDIVLELLYFPKFLLI